MRDLYFYPLAIVVIALIIGVSLSVGDYERPTDAQIKQSGYNIADEDLTRLTASEGTNYEYVGATQGSPAFARLWTHQNKDNVGASAGVFAPLNSDYERAFAGERLRMIITARQSQSNPLEGFEAGYFTAGAGDSGWKTFSLTREWADYEFEFQPGFPKADPDIDYFGIWPGRTAETLSMDVSEMRIEVLN